MPRTNTNQGGQGGGGSILDRATIVSVRIGRLGVQRKVPSARVQIRDAEHEPDAAALRVSKELIDCPEYDQIVGIDNEARTTLLRFAVPSKLRVGSYLVPDRLLDRVDGLLEEYQGRRAALVDAFVAAYADAVQSARKRLGDLFEAGDYADPDDVAAAFTIRIRYESWGAPSRLESLSQRMYSRERDRAQRELADAATEIRDAMRIMLRDMVGHLSEVLQTGADGKARVFRDTAVNRLTDFLETFGDRNIAQDDALAELVEEARGIIAGSDPKTLRTAPVMRQFVRDGMARIRAQLETMTQTRGRRFGFGASPSAAEGGDDPGEAAAPMQGAPPDGPADSAGPA